MPSVQGCDNDVRVPKEDAQQIAAIRRTTAWFDQCLMGKTTAP